jgi:hypothetical protein
MPETENDPSASTASFRAFAQQSDDEAARRRSTPVNRAVIFAVAIVCAAIVIGLLVTTL